MVDDPSLDTSTAISPLMQQFLNGVAGPESGGSYNVRYGGAKGPQTFNDYSTHPNTPEAIPNSKLHSTAAGKYQFIGSTWDNVASKLGLKDFSPQSQDRGAAYLATSEYKRVTGRDLETDLKDPTKYAGIATALQNQWGSLKPQNIAVALNTPLPPDTTKTAASTVTGPTVPLPSYADTAAKITEKQAAIDRLASDQQYLKFQKLAAINKLIMPSVDTTANNPFTQAVPWARAAAATSQSAPSALDTATQLAALQRTFQGLPTGPTGPSLLTPVVT